MKSILARDMRANDSLPVRRKAGESKPAPDLAATPTFRIEKGVPLPAVQRHGSPCPYPFSEMEPGDSFVIPVPLGSIARDVASKLRTVLGTYRRRGGEGFFAIRQVDDGRNIRVWRTEKADGRGRKRRA